MKKFFKALAVVMALTLVIGTIPASAATTGPKTAKKLYIGGAKGEDANGVKSSVKKSVSYAYLLGITKDQAADAKVTAKSSKKTIAKARNDKQRVYAKGIGKATVTLSYKGKDYKVKVTVKKNADKVNFGADWASVDDTFEAEAGTEYTVSLPRLDGSTKLDTDKRRLEASDESVVIAPVEGQPRSYTVKFTKTGEYTVTGIAYQSETYSKATASKAVFVTVKGGAFYAQPTGVKEITVEGTGFTKDSKFVVKHGSVGVTVDSVTASEDGTKAVLKLATRIMKGEYTVTGEAGETSKFDAEDEYVKEIIIKEDGGEVATETNADKSVSILVHYDVLNQYGESVRKAYAVSWNSSYGNDKKQDNTNLGIIRFTNSVSASAITFGSPVVISAVYTGKGRAVTANAHCTAGMENEVGAVEIKGIVDLETKKTYETVPANFESGKYAIYFIMNDRLGYPMKYNANDAKNLTFISQSPLVATFDNNGEPVNKSITIGDIEYAYIKLKNGYNTKQGGNVNVIVTSKVTGIKTDYVLKVDSAQVLDKIQLLQPESLVVEGEEVTIPYEAFDTEGVAITNFDVLNSAVTLNGTGFRMQETNDGKAEFKYAARNTGASKDIDATIMLMVLAKKAGSSSTLSLSVKDRSKVAAIETVSEKEAHYIIEGDTQKIYYKDNVWNKNGFVYYDQYDRHREHYESNIPSNYEIRWNSNNQYTTIANTTELDSDGNTVRLVEITAKNNVNKSEEEVIEFYLYDTSEKKAVSGSEKKVTYTVVDIKSVSSFEIGFDKWNLKDKEDTANPSVTAILTNGKKTHVPDSYVIYNYGVVKKVHGIDRAAQTSTGSALGYSPNWGDGTDPNNSFVDYSKKKADGTYETRYVDVELVATVYADLSVLPATPAAVGSTKAKIGVSNFAKKYASFNTHNWQTHVTYNGDSAAKCFIKPENGVITAAYLKEVLDNGSNNYGQWAGLDTTKVSVSITNYKETETGLYGASNNSNAAITNNMSEKVEITAAERGDTFTAEFTFENAKLTVEFTVGADKFAFVGDLYKTWYPDANRWSIDEANFY